MSLGFGLLGVVIVVGAILEGAGLPVREHETRSSSLWGVVGILLIIISSVANELRR